MTWQYKTVSASAGSSALSSADRRRRSRCSMRSCSLPGIPLDVLVAETARQSVGDALVGDALDEFKSFCCFLVFNFRILPPLRDVLTVLTVELCQVTSRGSEADANDEVDRLASNVLELKAKLTAPVRIVPPPLSSSHIKLGAIQDLCADEM
eukprot:350478-Rhodomonas_salina.1